jgi:hypothetical protein
MKGGKGKVAEETTGRWFVCVGARGTVQEGMLGGRRGDD